MTKKLNKKDLAQLHYSVDRYKNPEKHITKQLRDSPFELKSLERGVAHYKNINTGENIISLKGTNPKNFKDLRSDIMLGLGLAGADKQFRRRTNQIKDIYRSNDGDNILIGHSLGGSTALHALTKNKSIRDNTKQAHLFNSGYSGAFHKELKGRISPEVKKELDSKITHHIIKGDVISGHLKEQAIGKVKEYSIDSINPLEKHSIKSFD